MLSLRRRYPDLCYRLSTFLLFILCSVLNVGLDLVRHQRLHRHFDRDIHWCRKLFCSILLRVCLAPTSYEGYNYFQGQSPHLQICASIPALRPLAGKFWHRARRLLPSYARDLSPLGSSSYHSGQSTPKTSSQTPISNLATADEARPVDHQDGHLGKMRLAKIRQLVGHLWNPRRSRI